MDEMITAILANQIAMMKLMLSDKDGWDDVKERLQHTIELVQRIYDTEYDKEEV